MAHDWGYCEHNGPQIWPEKFDLARNGTRQSPIDISTADCVVKDADETPLQYNYPQTMSGLAIQNTGHGWKVDIPDNLAANTYLRGGPLQHNYRLAQFHCHWGKTCSEGSEHKVNGKSYAAELHFVHWNTDLYSSAGEALPSNDGLAVLGVFLEIGPNPNEELNKLLTVINHIIFKGEKSSITHDLHIERLLPENKSYWTYPGSLTTPPLSESVTWIVFSDPIQCTEEQIAKFRDMCFCGQSERIVDRNLIENFRSTQPVNNRRVTFVRH